MKKRSFRAYNFTLLAFLVSSTNVLATAVTTAVPPGGSYLAAKNVQLKTSEPATVYCTTDGTVPQMTPDYVCDSTIPIATDTVLTFFSVDQVGVAEQTRTETYVIVGGEIRSWGSNDWGELGDGTITSSLTPVQVNGLTEVVSVSGGSNYPYSAAVKKDGTAWTWGSNVWGQLGVGDGISLTTTPVQVNMTDVVSISAKERHTLALRRDGTVWAWGHNNYGQLGNGTSGNSYTPVQVSGLTNVVAVAGGKNHSVALKKDGTVWAWGDNSSGQLGDGTQINRLTPVQVEGLTGIISISAGTGRTVAVKKDGTLWSWGFQVGDGTGEIRLVPVQVLTGVASVSTGRYHSVALKNDGTVWAWGENTLGQLGDGTKTTRLTPVQATGITEVASISAGADFTMAVKQDGTGWAWGSNSSGEFGNGTQIGSTVPVPAGISSVGMLSAGGTHALAVVQSPGTYIIYTTAGPNGSISPSGEVSVLEGASQTFNITPATGYHVADVLVDGSSVGAVGSYTFTNVTANHTISATFAINTYTITSSSGVGGVISPSGAVILNYGDSQTFTVTPNAGYSITDVLVDGSSVGAVTSYTFTNVTGDHTISATYIQNLTVTAPNGGENWKKGTTQNITWSYIGNPGSTVKIELLKGGAFYKTITSGTSIGSGGSGSYNWTIPQGVTAGTEYSVRITSIEGSAIDISDGNFTISR